MQRKYYSVNLFSTKKSARIKGDPVSLFYSSALRRYCLEAVRKNRNLLATRIESQNNNQLLLQQEMHHQSHHSNISNHESYTSYIIHHSSLFFTFYITSFHRGHIYSTPTISQKVPSTPRLHRR